MIKRQEGYQLKNIEGVYHLLPFGQKVADQKRGITMNETGVFLWNALETPRPDEELICLAAEHYGIIHQQGRDAVRCRAALPHPAQQHHRQLSAGRCADPGMEYGQLHLPDPAGQPAGRG